MSAKTISREFQLGRAQGNLKKLGRMRPAVVLQASGAPRNPVALALATRRASSAAGKHIRSQGAQRRAERVALQKAVRGGFGD
ncbi:MAG: hypothetical protein Q4G70_07595 [Pseudomonadota bacterium]|nr:hypothetical protein [Pseudomonadota bacterium]